MKNIKVYEDQCDWIDEKRGDNPRNAVIKELIEKAENCCNLENKHEILNLLDYLEENTYYQRGMELKILNAWSRLGHLINGNMEKLKTG